MNAPVIIRPASRADLPQLLALYPHLDPADRIPTLDVAERRLEELQKYEGSAIFVALREGDIVASCTLIVIPNLTRGGQPYGLIENVVTHLAFRGLGLGKQILKAAVEAAWQLPGSTPCTTRGPIRLNFGIACALASPGSVPRRPTTAHRSLLRSSFI